MTQRKQCSDCRTHLPLTSEYFTFTKGRYRPICKVCASVREHLNAISNEHGQSVPDIKIPAALALRAGGFTYKQIASDLDVTVGAVVSLFADQLRAA